MRIRFTWFLSSTNKLRCSVKVVRRCYGTSPQGVPYPTECPQLAQAGERGWNTCPSEVPSGTLPSWVNLRWSPRLSDDRLRASRPVVIKAYRERLDGPVRPLPHVGPFRVQVRPSEPPKGVRQAAPDGKLQGLRRHGSLVIRRATAMIPSVISRAAQFGWRWCQASGGGGFQGSKGVFP